jgi:hypothetical protein
MLRIRRALLNPEGGGPTWVELDNSVAVEVPLGGLRFLVQPAQGQAECQWTGQDADRVRERGTLRLHNEAAVPDRFEDAEGRLRLRVPGLDLFRGRGGSLILREQGDEQDSDRVNIGANEIVGVVLYRLGNSLVSANY